MPYCAATSRYRDSVKRTAHERPGARGGGQALIAICDGHGLDDVVSVLDAWLDGHG
jgi:hypothetical protein